MKALCPKCGRELPLDDVNVAADTALCQECGEVFPLSEIVEGGRADDGDRPFDVSSPPRGAWYSDDGNEVRIGATTRSAIAWFLVPFMCVWSGFSLGGIYGTQFYKGQFDLRTTLFGIPFILGTLLFGSMAVMSVIGKVEVRLCGEAGEIFTGVGWIGWRQRFALADVERVREEALYSRGAGSSGASIVLEGQRRLTFGSGLSDERRHFVRRAVQTSLTRTARSPHARRIVR